MKIQDPNLSGQRPIESTGAVKTQGTAPGPDKTGKLSGPAGADQVQLSSLAEQLSVQDPTSAEREARIAKLAQDVEAGRYQPDASIIAAALIKEAAAGE